MQFPINKAGILLEDFERLLSQGQKEGEGKISEMIDFKTSHILVGEILKYIWPEIESYNKTTSVYDLSGLSESAKGIVGPLAFPARFVILAKIDEHTFKELKDVLLKCFVFGICTHFFMYQFPSRAKFHSVDLRKLYSKFIPESLVPRIHLEGLAPHIFKLENSLFEVHFHSNIEEFLTDKIQLGWWKSFRAKSYFRDLYFAGVLYGLMLDLETKNK